MNTTYFLNLLAGNIFKTKTSPAIPSGYYLGLSTSAPSVSGTGVSEPSGGGYARVKIASLGAPSNGIVRNTADISFAESQSNWGVLRYFVIYDAATGGNLLMYGLLPEARTAESGTTIVIRTGSLGLSFADMT